MKSIVKVALTAIVALAAAQPASAQILRRAPSSGTVVRDGNGNVVRQDGTIVQPDGTVIDARTGQVIGHTRERFPDTRTSRSGQPGDNRMRVHRDANGCLVKEQQKKNGDYRYERKCNGKGRSRGERDDDDRYENDRRRDNRSIHDRSRRERDRDHDDDDDDHR